MLKILALTNHKEKMLFALAIFLMIIATIAEISQPLFFIQIGNQVAKFTDGENNDAIVEIVKWSSGMLAVVLFGMLTYSIVILIVTKATTSLVSRTRMLFFNKVLNLSTNKVDEYGVSPLVVRTTSDLTNISNAIYVIFTLIIRASLYVVTGFVLAMIILTSLTDNLTQKLDGDQYWLVMTFIAIPLVLFLAFILIYRTRKYFSQERTYLDQNNQIMLENIVGEKIIRAFRIQKNQETRFDIVNNGLMKSSRTGEITIHLTIPLIVLSLNLSIMFIQVIFAILAKKIGVEKEAIEELQIIIQAFMQFFSLVLVGIVLFASSLFMTQRAKPSSKRVNEILEMKSSIIDGTSNKKINNPSVEFKNVHFRYAKSKNKNGIDTITNINFKIEAGQTLGIIGSTGSGKSTLVSLISRLYDVTKGEVLIDGVNVKDYKLSELNSAISVAFQDKILFKGTIKSNILMGKEKATDDEILTAAKNAEAYEFIESREKQFDAEVQEGGSNLSGGQKQRLSIARALVKNPKILVFDDSLSALDNITERKLLKNISKNLGNMTLIIVAQRIKSIQNADQIIFLEDGRVSAIGTHDELIKDSDLYQQIFDSQNTEIGG